MRVVSYHEGAQIEPSFFGGTAPVHDVVRMHRHGGDETVWYFARAQDCVYIMYISDSM